MTGVLRILGLGIVAACTCLAVAGGLIVVYYVAEAMLRG